MTLRIFGVSFRSRKHFEWFGETTALLCLSVFLTVALLWSPKGPGISYAFVGIFLFLAFFYAIITVVAVIETNWGKKNHELFSKDCIWFNTAVALALISLSAILTLKYPP